MSDDYPVYATAFAIVWTITFLSGVATGFGLAIPAVVASIAASVTIGGAAAFVWALDRGDT